MKIGCPQFCSVYTGVLSHLENNWLLLLCLFVNILQICRTKICTLWICQNKCHHYKSFVVLFSPSGGILITATGTNLDSVAEPVMVVVIIVNRNIAVYYQVMAIT